MSAQVLGETGGTVVYIFPDGNASVKKGKKAKLLSQSKGSELHEVVSTLSEPASSPQRHTSNRSTQNQRSALKPPPPPPVHAGSKLNSGISINSSSKRNEPKGHVLKESKLQQQLDTYLLKQGLVTSTQLEVAKYDSENSGLSLEDVLLARGWVTQEAIDQHLQQN